MLTAKGRPEITLVHWLVTSQIGLKIKQGHFIYSLLLSLASMTGPGTRPDDKVTHLVDKGKAVDVGWFFLNLF